MSHAWTALHPHWVRMSHGCVAQLLASGGAASAAGGPASGSSPWLSALAQPTRTIRAMSATRSSIAPMVPRSRENPALLVAVLQALEADRVARGPPVGLLGRGVLPDVGVGVLHPALEPGHHVLELPLLGALVLQPLVVRDDHAARVTEDVGDDVDALAEQDVLGLGVGRAVRALDHQLDLERLGLVDADLELERGRHEDVGLEREELLARDLGRALVVRDRAGLLDVLAELVRVDALAVGDVAADVADADHDGALLR